MSSPDLRELTLKIDNFGTKLDDFSQILLAVSRLEDRQMQYADTLKRLFGSIEKFEQKVDNSERRLLELIERLDKRLDDVEQQQIQNNQRLAFAERFFWIVVTAGTGLVMYYLRG